MTRTFEISIHNPYQDIGQTNSAGFVNNLSFDPTVEEVNRVSSAAGGITESGPQEEEYEPLFGTHIREAASTLKKVFLR